MAETLQTHSDNGRVMDEESVHAAHDGLDELELGDVDEVVDGAHPEHHSSVGEYIRETAKSKKFRIGAAAVAAGVVIGTAAYKYLRDRPTHNID